MSDNTFKSMKPQFKESYPKIKKFERVKKMFNFKPAASGTPAEKAMSTEFPTLVGKKGIAT